MPCEESSGYLLIGGWSANLHLHDRDLSDDMLVLCFFSVLLYPTKSTSLSQFLTVNGSSDGFNRTWI